MNASHPAQNPVRFIGLFPDVLGIGGVQEVSRQTIRALLEISAHSGWSPGVLGLNDPPGVQEFSAGARKSDFRGFGRSKVRFVLAALQNAAKKPRVVLAAHPNLAPPAAWMKRLAPQMKVIVMAHGVEVWQPLPPRRRAAGRARPASRSPRQIQHRNYRRWCGTARDWACSAAASV